MSDMKPLTFNSISVEQRTAIVKLFAGIRKIAGKNLWRIPTYVASNVYRNSILLDDIYTRFFDKNGINIFKETSGRIGFLTYPSITHDKQSVVDVVRRMTTDGVFATDLFLRFWDKGLLDSLVRQGLASIDTANVNLAFRTIPMPSIGFLLCDPSSYTGNDAIHIGLDSMYLWRYLANSDLLRSLECTRGGASAILDLGCGSGVHSILIKSKLPEAAITCADINNRALHCSEFNLGFLNLGKSVCFQQSNWFDNIHSPEKGFDLIVCNPPFEWHTESMKSRGHHAMLSNDGGDSFGLNHTLHVLDNIRRFLSADSKAIMITQTLVRNDGTLLIAEFLKSRKGFTFEILPVFEHFLASQEQARLLFEHGFSHFALVLVKVHSAIKGGVSINDQRSLAKKASDYLRVNYCKRFWKEQIKCES